MNLKCLFGMHAWNACKCERCGKVRDEEHDWSENRGPCEICGKKYSFVVALTQRVKEIINEIKDMQFDDEHKQKLIDDILMQLLKDSLDEYDERKNENIYKEQLQKLKLKRIDDVNVLRKPLSIRGKDDFDVLIVKELLNVYRITSLTEAGQSAYKRGKSLASLLNFHDVIGPELEKEFH